MTHPERDPDLLLMAHGELSPIASIPVRWHLNRCPDCRRRLAALQQVSTGYARAIHPASPLSWTTRGRLAPATVAAWVVALLAAVILAGLVIRNTASARIPARTDQGLCRADLPNDKCR